MALIDLILQHPDVVRPARGNREAVAWCPWHPDKDGKNPNLHINPQKKIAKCFNCGQSGLRKLARSWGIEEPDQDRRKRKAPEPFLSAAGAMARLQEAYALRPETIAHFGIEPVPDAPSPTRITKGAWRYETAAGVRYKAFDRSSTDKYWWGRGTRTDRRHAPLYGEPSGPEIPELVYLVNGEPSVWVCWQAGVPAVCAFGEGNLPRPALDRLSAAGVRHVRLVLDLDAAGNAAKDRDAQLLRDAGLEVSAGQLPEVLGSKGDVSDLYVFHRGDDGAFRVAIAALPEAPLPDPDPLADTRFFARDGRFYLRQPTRDGMDADVPLTNFTARAEEEIIVDDGWDQTRYVVLSGQLEGGHTLPRVQVPAGKSLNLDWIPDKWGYSPIIRSGPGAKDNVREIMQRLSTGLGMGHRVVYGHTGWRQLDGVWRFLMPGGAVGTDGIDVELMTPYARYSLPNHPEHVLEGAKASLRFLDVGARLVTIPILALAYLAPLQSILMPAFTVWLRANTGSFKSTLCALVLSHFGEFQYNTPPATWEATARGLERYLFDLKDVVAWVDDFNPRQSEREMNAQNAKADAILRSLGNLQGRLRMRADLSLQKTYLPRAMLISTGEIYPTGESVIARTLVIEYQRAQIDVPRLTQAQREAHLYREAMAGFVMWLGERYEQRQAELPKALHELRARATEGSAREHARTPGALAALQVAIDLMGEFMCDIGAATSEEMEALSDEAWETLQEIGRQQKARLQEESPVEQFFNILDTLLSQHKVEFHRRGVDQHPTYGVDLIGWYDNERLYLDPAASLNRVAKWLRDEGRVLGTNQRGLHQALLEGGYLIKQGKDSHLFRRVSVNGRQHRVVTLDRALVPFAEHFPRELM